MKAIYLVAIITLVVGSFIIYLITTKSEKFKVLGALGPYKDLYYHCMASCEKTDPRKQLLKTHGNYNCANYCDSVITDLSRRGDATFPRDFKVAPPEIATEPDRSYNMCGDGTKAEVCRAAYSTDNEINQRCTQDCQYSTQTNEECMRLCKDSYNPNFEGSPKFGWGWK
jgi:hypothetical protein